MSLSSGIAQTREVQGTDADHPPALVLGAGITTLGVIRVLGRAGLQAYVPEQSDKLILNSRWFRGIDSTAGPIREGTLAEWLRNAPVDRAVLIPCSDHWASEVARLDPALKKRFPVSISAPSTLDRFIDKAQFADMLQSVGIPHPWSRTVETDADLTDVPDELFASAILKPVDSQSFVQRFHVKAFHVPTRAQAVDRLRTLRAEGWAVILQEYIPGDAERHFFVDGFVDRTGAVRAVFVRQRLRMHPADFGNSTFMVSVPVDAAGEAVDTITSLLRRVSYRGIFSAEFKRDPRDGVFKLLEVNARAWWYVEFAARCGVDVCRMAYDDALERRVPDVTTYAIGRTLSYPYLDFFACRELYRQGRLSLPQWIRSWSRADQPIFQVADPAPGISATVKIATGFLKKKYRTR